MNTAHVKLKKSNTEKVVSLPSFSYEEKDAKTRKMVKKNDTKITVKMSSTMADQRLLIKEFPNAWDQKHDDCQNALIRKVVNGIVSWNLEGEDDKIVEINDENVVQLDEIDVLFLLWEISGKELVRDGVVLSQEEISENIKKA